MGEFIELIELWSPQSFKDATPEEIAATCNGAGPRGYGWMVPDNFYGLSITAAANIHDWQYGEARTNLDRLHADLTFFRNMVVLIMQEDVKQAPAPGDGIRVRLKKLAARRLTYLRLRMAVRYFIAVWRAGGAFAETD